MHVGIDTQEEVCGGERRKLLAVAPSACGVGVWARGVCAFHFYSVCIVFFDIVYIVQECYSCVTF